MKHLYFYYSNIIMISLLYTFLLLLIVNIIIITSTTISKNGIYRPTLTRLKAFKLAPRPGTPCLGLPYVQLHWSGQWIGHFTCINGHMVAECRGEEIKGYGSHSLVTEVEFDPEYGNGDQNRRPQGRPRVSEPPEPLSQHTRTLWNPLKRFLILGSFWVSRGRFSVNRCCVQHSF